MGLFTPAKPLKEQIRENKRTIDRAVRELNRETNKLKTTENKLKIEIKKAAQSGQMQIAKLKAKDLVRTRKNVQKFTKMKTQMTTISLRLTTIGSNNAMANVMKNCAKVMGRMNQMYNVPKFQNIMMEFERQSELMDAREEMMEDTMEDVFAESDEEEEEEEIIGSVLAEIGIDLASGQIMTGQNQNVSIGNDAKSTRAY
eukprot:TRINITY_DN2692_c0_g1_i1.p1 TRINITY_DN2692_c0_g1~~TRINITY_DN2692_c0_g1_i1.p1  ORF type:complete len:213 (-),score=61.26 TRINITY_DN2692_c0_g1_i1:35-634(-)